ncbi:MAG: MFS transporter [Brachybacterium sp.]
MSAFSSVILTFVFATYVASAVASEGAVGEEAITAAQAHGSQVLTTWQSIGAVAVALLAPLLGNLADRGGARNALLRITTLATVVVIALMPLVALDSDFLVLGSVLIALAVVFSELAGVFVNSVLPEISSPADRGRISGTAWAVGYWGSIGCLGLVLVLFVMPGTGILGITGENGWNYRAIPLFVALWILAGTMPLMLRAPKHPASAPGEKWNPWQGYAHIVRRVIRAFREEPVMLQYLVASAIYRDGLGAVFSIAGVLAANAYGFSFVEIIIFGIAANLVAGVGVYLGGKVDDRVGPRPVIIAGSLGVIVLGLVVLFFGSSLVFWIAGLAICLFVGPVQSASRNLLTRLSQPGRETENFGLYATTGRALGFLGTAAFAATVAISGETRTGILGIVLVMALGLIAFVPIRLGAAGRAAGTV